MYNIDPIPASECQISKELGLTVTAVHYDCIQQHVSLTFDTDLYYHKLEPAYFIKAAKAKFPEVRFVSLFHLGSLFFTQFRMRVINSSWDCWESVRPDYFRSGDLSDVEVAGQ